MNERLKDMKLTKNSPDTVFLYEMFLACFGPSAYDISVDRYLHDLFIVCLNLSVNPLVPGEQMVSRNVTDRSLNPIDAGTLDCELILNEKLAKNTLVYFCSVSDIIVHFDQNGLPANDI